VHYESITTQSDLIAFCSRLAGAARVAFDTEFVSEDTYLPDLCLIQVAYDEDLAIIDPRTVGDVRPFWECLATNKGTVIAHASREEYRFCLRATGRGPGGLNDVQIAAALVGLEYPASLQTVLGKVLGKSLPKGETRTDWRRRPLSRRQIEYALHDVAHLLPLWDALHARLRSLDRLEWLDEEMATWQARIQEAEGRKRWRRISGLSGMSARQLAVARELWNWRESEAQRRNQPAKRILRDDLLVELSRRKTADPKRIRAVRGLQQRNLRAYVPDLAECVARALALPDADCPQPVQRESLPQLNVIAQLMSTAMAIRCRSLNVAPSLAATVQDLRELIGHRLGIRRSSPQQPALASGWRAEVVGQLVEDFLAGRLALRITDPLSDDPIRFEKIGP
jgi:ribonuclease D